MVIFEGINLFKAIFLFKNLRNKVYYLKNNYLLLIAKSKNRVVCRLIGQKLKTFPISLTQKHVSTKKTNFTQAPPTKNRTENFFF